ncbi:MAG: hypothetical protein WCK85_05580 [Chlorobium sp.]
MSTVCACPIEPKNGDKPQEKEPDVMPKNRPFFLEKTASEWAVRRIERGMIGTNYPKTNIVVCVAGGIVVPGRTTQIVGIIVPGTAAQRTGRSVVGSFPVYRSNK